MVKDRYIYKVVNGSLGDTHVSQMVGMSGNEFDLHSEDVHVWDTGNTDHVWLMPRTQLVKAVTVKILWWDENDNLIYASK